MPQVNLRLRPLTTSQRRIKRQASRFNVVDCGRRWGKTALGQDLAITTALTGKPVGWFAPTYKYLLEVFQELVSTIYPIIKRSNTTEKRIELLTGGLIEFWSLADNPDAGRSRKYKRVIVDEAAKAGNLAHAWDYAMRATLIDYVGDAWFLSTPKGMNYFYSLYQQGIDKQEGWTAWKMPTTANPHIPKSEIEAAQKALPDRVFQQEFLAEFVADGSYFQNIDACCVLESPDSPADHSGHTFGLGIDWGQSNDFTVGTIGCRECDRAVDWFRFNGLSYPVQRERIVDYCKKWPGVRVLPERNSIGQPNIEDLRLIEWLNDKGAKQFIEIALGADGQYGFQTTAVTKPTLIEQLYLALMRGRKYPKEYADEFRAYEVTMRANGAPSFSAPEGQKDDRVISAALENYLAMSALQVF